MPPQLSAPNAPNHTSVPNPEDREIPTVDPATLAATNPRAPDAAYLPRAASYTYFPKIQDAIFEESGVLQLKGTISEEDLTVSSTTGDGDSSSSSTGPETEPLPVLEMSRRPSLTARKSSKKSTVSKFLSRQNPRNNDSEQQSQNKDTKKSSSPVRALTKLRRKSWIAPSPRDTSPAKSPPRSPSRISSKDNSPVKTVDANQNDQKDPKKLSEDQRSRSWNVGAGRRMSMIGRSREKEAETKPDAEPVENGSVIHRRKNLRKTIARPSSVFVRGSTPVELSLSTPGSPRLSPNIPAVPQVPKSFSTDRLPMLPHPASVERLPPAERVPTLPRQLSIDKLRGSQLKTEAQRKKDELWNVFRTLDGDYQKFQSKSIALKANVVRSTLAPFLRTYATHPSNQRLRVEDLDRRINILNKWWTGLLEMIAGRNNQSISGTDRPAVLEAVVGIMERPEWRLRPSPFSPHNSSGTMTPALHSKSYTSISSASSDFLTESVQHNVRNIFTQNLLSQMAFVVDKMSLRNAPASLVHFCGRSAAYAFFFCPGIGDMLVRLWAPSPDIMRRVMEENGVSRLDKLDQVSDTILPYFPPNMHSMKTVSFRQLCQELRRPCQLPIGAVNLDWHGPWVKRWTGAESDLFYVFAKHYHVLVNEFLPPETTRQERLCAPGLLLVQTQMLANLDATIHRHSNNAMTEESNHGASSITFDDVLAGEPDATAAPLPIAPTNATRLMAENRLIMLLRDVLSERTTNVENTRPMFAEAFCQILKACARKVSLYDHNASYTLCDFLEEAVGIVVRYEQVSKQDLLDWPFWLSVCRKMAESHNTATEIRLYSFLFSIWGTIISDPDRKIDTCLDFLLEETFFESRFNHWCPMVRSYYMRLLCWRVARFDGDAGDGDIVILDKFLEELRRVWSHFLFLKEEAESLDTLLPSTVPCYPAPGRRLLIIRTDAPVHSPSGSFFSFDGIASPASQQVIQKRDSVLEPLDEPNGRPSSAMSNASSDFGLGAEDTGKKRWSIFKSFMGVSAPRSKSRSPGPKNKAPSPQKSGTTTPTPNLQQTSPNAVPTHRSFCFRFSLEWGDKRGQILHNMRLITPRLPQPAQQYLHSNGKMLPTVLSERPEGPAVGSSKYAGRALAEWSLVVNECQNFFERRKNEGVPANKWVETPTLTVENFKKPG